MEERKWKTRQAAEMSLVSMYKTSPLHWHRKTPVRANIVFQNNPIISSWQVYKIPSEQVDDGACNNTLPII